VSLEGSLKGGGEELVLETSKREEMASTTATTTVTAHRPQPQAIFLQLRLPETHVTSTITATNPGEEQQQEPMHVTWDSGIVDNEKMNKRKSKKCCIFHKQRPFDESDSEDDDDDEGGWEIDGSGRPVWVGKSTNKHNHDDDHHGCSCDDH
jgi:protein phosphatase 1 regulatory subunit 11